MHKMRLNAQSPPQQRLSPQLLPEVLRHDHAGFPNKNHDDTGAAPQGYLQIVQPRPFEARPFEACPVPKLRGEHQPNAPSRLREPPARGMAMPGLPLSLAQAWLKTTGYRLNRSRTNATSASEPCGDGKRTATARRFSGSGGAITAGPKKSNGGLTDRGDK